MLVYGKKVSSESKETKKKTWFPRANEAGRRTPYIGAAKKKGARAINR